MLRIPSVLLLIALAILAQPPLAQPPMAREKISPWLRRNAGFAYVVEFRPDMDMRRARGLVEAGGFDLLPHPDLLPNHLLALGPSARLEELAALDGVTHILPASIDLVAGRRVIACSGGIAEGATAGDYVKLSGWAPDAKGMVALQYFFESLTDKLDRNTAEGEIERAFREWEKYGKFTLSPGGGADSARTLKIEFATGEHGDAYPFTSIGLLAHTFYPPPLNAEPLAGSMHFNGAENWQVGSGVDLYSVALHEIGHALGLGHSDQPGSVMYPYYHAAGGLTSDDIAGIQSLYGAAGTGSGATGSGTPGGTSGGTGSGQPPSTTPPATPPATPPVTPPVTPPATPPATPPVSGTPPSLTITVPGSTIIWTSARTLTVSGTASDAAGVSLVTWSTSNGDAGSAAGTTSWSASVPLLVGDTVIVIRAYDTAGNSAWRSITAVRQ